MGIATTGAAIFNLVAHAGEHLTPEVRWLLVGAIGIALISIALLTRTIQLTEVEQNTHRVGARVMITSALLIMLLGFTSLETIPLLIVVLLLLLAPVIFAFRVWVGMLDQAD